MPDTRSIAPLGDYSRGLDAITALQPVRFRWLGNERFSIEPDIVSPHPMSPHWQKAKDGIIEVGLIAQDAEAALPEAVLRLHAFVDNASTPDFRIIDPYPLIYVLINAVKELAARVEDLESR